MKNATVELKPLDLLEISLSHRWLIILPLCISVMIGLYFSFTLPKIYEASTLVLVQPNKVPDAFVRSVVTRDAESRLSSTAQMILSRTNIERIIRDLNLVPEGETDPIIIENKIGSMQRNTVVEIAEDPRGSNAFSVSFRGTDPQTVMQVTNALATYFIDTSDKERETSAVGTSIFLAEELESTRERLREMEAMLKEYRQQYMGELPEQLNSNLTILQRLQEQLNTKEDNLRSIRLSLSMIENQIKDGQYYSTLGDLSGKSNTGLMATETTDPEILKQQLEYLRTRYTENHPDVKNLKNKIAQLESKTASEGVGLSLKQDTNNSSRLHHASPASRQAAELIKEKNAMEASIQDLNREIAIYQRRVEGTPKREQEYITLRRDYDNLSELYKSLLNRKLEAEMSASLEKQQKDEQFKIIDSARLPINPVGPNLMKLFILSIGFGLVLGYGTTFFLEYTKNTFEKPEEIEAQLKLPVVAMIPSILSKRDSIKRRIEMTLCGFLTFVTFVAIFTFIFITRVGTEESLETIKRILRI